jgi:hypothetical protein
MRAAESMSDRKDQGSSGRPSSLLRSLLEDFGIAAAAIVGFSQAPAGKVFGAASYAPASATGSVADQNPPQLPFSNVVERNSALTVVYLRFLPGDQRRGD